MNDTSLNIRMIQHYMYCPRRFALMQINKDWNDNAFVISADIMHEHVHDGSHSFSDSRKTVKSSVALYNDLPEYDLFGIADCIEFIKDKNGSQIYGLDGNYKVRIVEYKPRAPKDKSFNETDAIQVFAQKICADHVWDCSSEAYIYYSDTRKRVVLPFDEEYRKYDEILKKYISEMRAIISSHTIPDRQNGQKCSGCSISDICFPKNKKYNVKNIIMSMEGAEPD